MSKSFFITTPIFYPNDRLHLGHAYTTIITDVIARYKKSQGYQVYFQTGSDEHGEKIEKRALSLGLTPRQLVNKNVSLFQQLWKELNISEHVFYRTSSSEHKQKVQKIFTKLLKQGDIYLGKYKGSYCITCEDYISESKITKEKTCPFFHSELREIEEPAYFLRVSKYRSWLVEYYSQNSNFLLPASIRKELFENFLKDDIRDLCITRSDIKWGIPVPSHEKMVIYVWFEALLNYLNSEPGEKFFLSEFSEEKKVNNAKEVSCMAIQNKDDEYLLVYNKKFGGWQFPSGKLEKGENAEEAAKREVFEETNLIIDNLEKIGEKTFCVNNIWWKFYFYRTEKYSGELLIKEKEIIGEIKFLEISKIQEINSQDQDEVTRYLLGKLIGKESEIREIIQIIGKEITRFHAIYWPIILKLWGARLPNKILVHGWLVDSKGEKSSKSKGNVIDPLELLKKYPPDLIRVYSIAKINFLQDGICSEELLRSFYQDFLVNNLSNLVSRVNKMLHLYNNGIIPKFEKNEKLTNYYQKCKLSVEGFQKKMDQYELTNAFSHIQSLLDASNKLITILAPWELAQKGEINLLRSTLNSLANGIKILAFLLNSIMPKTSEAIFKVFNIEKEILNWSNLLDFELVDDLKAETLKKHLFYNFSKNKDNFKNCC